MNRHSWQNWSHPQCVICREPVRRNDTPYGAAPLDELKACNDCIQEAIKLLMKQKGIPIPKET